MQCVDFLKRCASDEIDARYKKAKEYVDKLSQSILAKAFRWELVPQDPNDPLAPELLAKKLDKNIFDKDGKESKSREKDLNELS